ncbi:MAG: division/cell wall cluster transcriptional repressor MraZ [Bacteroidetes bacterium]|nr:division/cell wall cluster transcriptional repressor MraZ [Bacteroidota bacterium]MCL5027130.1 division/cell wall cluster transcriptional repressor MraZ [Chloroflexota bacterium]
MFLSQYQHSVDDKGRLSIPSKYRAELASGLYLTTGFDNCLLIYPEAEWKVLVERMAKLPLTNPDARSFRRLIFSSAADCRMDQQGRIVIPPYMREFAKIKNEVIIMGVSEFIEIWAREVWDQEEANQRERANAVGQRQQEFEL